MPISHLVPMYLSTNSSNTLFHNRDIFEIDFDPGPLRFRCTETREITKAIQSLIQGKTRHNLIIRGMPGTGKTTVLQKVLSEVRQSNGNFIPIRINCQVARTLSQVVAPIYLALYGSWPTPHAHTTRVLMDQIGKELVTRNAVVLICFEDADHLVKKYVFNEILQTLIHLPQQYPPVKVGIFISLFNMDSDPGRYLDSRVLATFREEVVFHPYTRKEVGEILRDRVLRGLSPDTISARLLWQIVQETMPDGDIRKGLDLLKRAVMSAEQAGRYAVSEKDIEGLLLNSAPSGMERPLSPALNGKSKDQIVSDPID